MDPGLQIIHNLFSRKSLRIHIYLIVQERNEKSDVSEIALNAVDDILGRLKAKLELEAKLHSTCSI